MEMCGAFCIQHGIRQAFILDQNNMNERPPYCSRPTDPSVHPELEHQCDQYAIFPMSWNGQIPDPALLNCMSLTAWTGFPLKAPGRARDICPL
jgi:hypothetical protein